MHTGNSILMRAPRERIFETAADLSRWPEILPHYRYIHYYERSPERNVVKMAAVRSGIPISWVSEQRIDRDAMRGAVPASEGVHQGDGGGVDFRGDAGRRSGEHLA